MSRSLLCSPPEVLSQVIEKLDLKGILRCRQVCKLLRQVVDSSISIQYTIELFASGVLDNSSASTLTKAQLLTNLRRHNAAWRYLRLPSNSIIIPNKNLTTAYDFSGGVFIQDVNKDFLGTDERKSRCTLSWLELPSSFHGVVGVERSNLGEQPRWTAREVDFLVSDVSLDVERDLIILVERKDTETILPDGNISYTITCKLHLLSFSSFSHHPDASQPTIPVSFVSRTSDFRMDIQLGGDHLAMLLSTRDIEIHGADRFFLCHWTSGVWKNVDAVYNKSVPQWDTVCFISHDALLLPDTNRSVLNIYTFTDDAKSLVHAVSLYLPQQTEGAMLLSIAARSKPTTRSPRPSERRLDSSQTTLQWAYQRRPFMTDPDSAIVVLTMQYSSHERSLEPTQTFVVHRSALVELASRGISSPASNPSHHPHLGNSLEWNAWGPHCTRWGLDAPPPDWVCYTHGQRFVSMIRVFNPRIGRTARIRVYDFNMMNTERDVPILNGRFDDFPQSAMRSKQRSDTLNTDVDYVEVNGKIGQPVTDPGDVGGGPTISRSLTFGDKSKVLSVTTKSVVSCPRIFVNDVVSSLPYRVLFPHEAFDWNSVMIDDERIVGLKEMPGEDSLEFLEVIVL